jgi:hypothetical protein
MLKSMKELEGYIIMASDGEIGEIDEFYFDDHTWKIRYFVVDCGTWLTSKRVLLSPHSIIGFDKDKKQVRFDLTKEKIKNAPGIDTDKPVSRQHETDLAGYYGWPAYWLGNGMEMMPAYVPVAPIPPANLKDIMKNTAEKEEKWDPHLRSTSEVIGYNIRLTDGELGHAEDFIFEESDLGIRYLVIDTKNILPGKKVLIALPWIKDIIWEESIINVDLEKEIIKSSPDYNPEVPIERDFEQRLHKHYSKNMFW